MFGFGKKRRKYLTDEEVEGRIRIHALKLAAMMNAAMDVRNILTEVSFPMANGEYANPEVRFTKREVPK
jgi:hypothetical protein